MFLTLFIFASIYAANPLNLEVQHSRKAFTLTIDRHNNILLDNQSMSLSLVKSKCNQKLVNRMAANFKRLTKKTPFSKKPYKLAMRVLKNRKAYYVEERSPASTGLMSIPGAVFRAKLEEKYLCGPKKKKAKKSKPTKS